MCVCVSGGAAVMGRRIERGGREDLTLTCARAPAHHRHACGVEFHPSNPNEMQNPKTNKLQVCYTLLVVSRAQNPTKTTT